MTAADRIWTWPGPTLTATGGHYRPAPHRPLDDTEGPTGTEYIRADLYAALKEINESQAAEIARMMKPR